MNSLKNNAGYRHGTTNSTKKTSIYTRENTATGPDIYRQTGSMLLESPRENAQLNRMTSEELAPIELPSPPENYSPLSKRFPPGLHSMTPGQLSTMRETHRGLLSKREPSNKTVDNDPRIIITPVADEFEMLNSPGLSSRTSPFTPKRGSVAQQLSFFIKKKLGTGTELNSLDSRNKIEDPLRRKSFLVTRAKPQRNEGGRLLNIMARQAVSNRNTDITKIFAVALEKLNVEALNRARKQEHLNKKRRLIKFFKQIRRNMYHLTDPWKPDSLFVVLWKFFIMCVILIQSWLSSYIVTFMPTEEANFNSKIFRWDFALDIVFIFEILSLFQIEYYHHGELHRDRRDIIVNYLTTTFPVDLITMLSLVGRFVPHSAFQNLMLLTILRIYKIPGLIASIIDYFQFSREISSLIRVIRLSGVVCILAHFCSCGLYAITKWEQEEENWVANTGLSGAPVEVIYVASLYWSVTTMSTTGFGDIAPRTVPERLFLVLVMILSSIVFGYILSTIGALLLEISAYSSEAREKIRVLTKYMNEKGLNKTIQSKIRKYLEFYLDRENTAKIEGDFIMKMLSNNLQEEIVREVNAKIMCDNYIFSSNFRRKFLYIISKDLVEKSFGPEETIFEMGSEGDCSIYFITSGKVDMCYERCGVSLQKLKKKASFGFTSFFSGRARDCTAKSVEFTTVFQLKRHRFMEKLESFQSEKETFFMIKDSINLYENFKYLNITCFSCSSPHHTIATCPEMHVVINREEAIRDYIEEQNEFKRTFNRRYRSRFSALKNLEQLQEAASQAQITHQNEQCYELDLEEEFVAQGTGGGSYSSVDEVLDRKIYDPKPLDFVADTVHMKYLDLTDQYRQQTSIGTLNQMPGSKRSKQKIGETEMFMKSNYDPYYHNLNLDRVRNFEVYYPNNNVARLMIDFERIRFEKIVQMRLGTKAKHISPLLMRGFRMFERKNSLTHPKVPSPSDSPATSPINFKKRHSVAGHLPRRESLRSNPGDIARYNSGNTNVSTSKKPSKYKLDSGSNPNSNKTSPVSSPYLSVGNKSQQALETTPKKRFNPLEFAKRIGRSRERGLSIIKEDTEKFDRGTYNNLSIEEKDAMLSVGKSQNSNSHNSNNSNSQNRHSLLQHVPSGTGPLDGSIDFTSFVNEIKGTATPDRSANTSFSRPKFANQIQEEDISSKSSLEQEPRSGAGEIGDYSKLVQTFPDRLESKPESLKPQKTKSTSKTETSGGKRPSVVEIKNKLFTMLVHDRVQNQDSSNKTRSASEDKGREASKVMEKYQLTQIFKKMSTFDED